MWRGPDLDNEIVGESASQMTIEGLLNNIISITPGYRWVIDDGVVNLIPAFNEPTILNFIVTEFDADDLISLDDARNRLLEMPALQKRSAELYLNTGLEIRVGGVRPPGSPRDSFSVHCRNKTLRETLNIMVRSQGRGVWEYRETHWDKHHGFSITFPIQQRPCQRCPLLGAYSDSINSASNFWMTCNSSSFDTDDLRNFTSTV